MMQEFTYLIGISLSLLAIGIAGIAANKHFIIIMLAIELILVASMIAVVTYLTYLPTPSPSGVVLLISIWAVAAVEIIVLVAFYTYMKYLGFDFDVTKLSRLKG